jgi:hypothetical protein
VVAEVALLLLREPELLVRQIQAAVVVAEIGLPEELVAQAAAGSSSLVMMLPIQLQQALQVAQLLQLQVDIEYTLGLVLGL